jgi:hypothetical protein
MTGSYTSTLAAETSACSMEDGSSVSAVKAVHACQCGVRRAKGEFEREGEAPLLASCPLPSTLPPSAPIRLPIVLRRQRKR